MFANPAMSKVRFDISLSLDGFMFPKTISLDEIVDGAYQLLGEAVGALLIVPPLWAAGSTPHFAHR